MGLQDIWNTVTGKVINPVVEENQPTALSKIASFFSPVNSQTVMFDDATRPATLGQTERALAQPPTPTPTPLPPVDMTSYEQLTAPTFDKYGVPRAVAFGMGDAEGGKINRFNIGATDSNPQNAVRYPDELSEATGAAKMLSGKAESTFYGNGERGRQQFEDAMKQNTLDEIMAAIRDAGYAGDPATWKQRSIDTGGAGKYYDTWDEFVKATRGYKKFQNR